MVIPEPSIMLHVPECCEPAVKSKVHAKSLQSCPTLCDPIDSSPPGSPVPGILQARTLEWVTVPSSRDLHDPGIEPASLKSTCIGRQALYH